MKAEDTVMEDIDIVATRVNASRYLRSTDESRHPLVDIEELAIAKSQASISFKAGMKEVVNWIKENKLAGKTYSLGFGYVYSFPIDIWQAKLKDWEL